MGAADYVKRLISRDRRRGTTLWAVFGTEDYLLALTADPVLLIAEYVVGYMRTGTLPPSVVFYSVTLDASCPDDVLAAVVTVPRDRFLPRDECFALLGHVRLWRFLHHPHGVQFGPLPHRERARRTD